jgi:ferredoxin
MIRVTHQREKCIGCGYCEEIAPYRWQMNKNDGKSDLQESVTKKGIQSALLGDDEYNDLMRSSSACPVKIIKVIKA